MNGIIFSFVITLILSLIWILCGFFLLVIFNNHFETEFELD